MILRHKNKVFKNKAFKILALLFALAFVSTGIHTSSSDYTVEKSPAPLDTLCLQETSQFENIIAFVFEMGFEIYRAIPSFGDSENETFTTKKAIVDWSYKNHDHVLLVINNSSDIKAVEPNVHFLEYIREIIPPPPKV